MINDVFPREWFRNYDQIKTEFIECYDYPEFDTLRDEICKCLICDLNIAAITLTNHLLEDFLKKMLIYKCADRNSDSIIGTFDESSNEFNSLNLYDSIERAFKYQLVNDEQRILLHKFRNEYRNPFSHADSKKIFNETTIGTQELKYEDGKYKVSEYNQIEITRIPFIHGLVKVKIAKDSAMSYFKMVDNIIREVLLGLKQSHDNDVNASE